MEVIQLDQFAKNYAKQNNKLLLQFICCEIDRQMQYTIVQKPTQICFVDLDNNDIKTFESLCNVFKEAYLKLYGSLMCYDFTHVKIDNDDISILCLKHNMVKIDVELKIVISNVDEYILQKNSKMEMRQFNKLFSQIFTKSKYPQH